MGTLLEVRVLGVLRSRKCKWSIVKPHQPVTSPVFSPQSSQSSLSQPSSSSSSSVSSISQWAAHSGPRSRAAGTTGGSSVPAGATEQDKKLKQYLEDERIALFLQNEEFMRELQRNREFLIALERGIKNQSRSKSCINI